MAHKVILIAVEHRTENVDNLQKVFTKHGCKVKARLGLHEAGNLCSEEGLIILQLVPDEQETDAFLNDLNSVKGVRAKFVEI